MTRYRDRLIAGEFASDHEEEPVSTTATAKLARARRLTRSSVRLETPAPSTPEPAPDDGDEADE